MIEVRSEPKLRGRRRRRDRSSEPAEALRWTPLSRSGASDRAEAHTGIEPPLSPALHAVAVWYPDRPVGW
jgi:hypothetical protein